MVAREQNFNSYLRFAIFFKEIKWRPMGKNGQLVANVSDHTASYKVVNET